MARAPQIQFFKDRAGHSIAYSAHGEGPLVICPAWWVSNVERDWSDPAFRSYFERLGEGLTLVRYDRPGVGLSDRSARSKTLDDEVAVIDDLAAELGADRYSIYAMSCGGPAGLTHAARHPDKIERLCFYGAYAAGPSICALDVQEAMLAMVRAHWGLGSRAMADVFLADADRSLLEEFARWQRESSSSEAAADLLELTYLMDASELMAAVRADTLVLHRRGDRAIPAECGRALATGIGKARLVMLDGRSHVPWFDGLEIAAMANAFLRGEDAPAAEAEAAGVAETGLDSANRCLVVDGERIALTPLEFAVMSELTATPNQVVTRDHLLEKVWKQPYEGSNRIDALMRGLRRKLGAHAAAIETVVGHGYRFTGWS